MRKAESLEDPNQNELNLYTDIDNNLYRSGYFFSGCQFHCKYILNISNQNNK